MAGNIAARTIARLLRAHSSVRLERCPDKAEVPGSSPGGPTSRKPLEPMVFLPLRLQLRDVLISLAPWVFHMLCATIWGGRYLRCCLSDADEPEKPEMSVVVGNSQLSWLVGRRRRREEGPMQRSHIPIRLVVRTTPQ